LKGNRLKILTKLLTVIVLLAIILALGLFILIQSNYVAKPLEKILSNYLGLDTKIQNIEFNIKYPETILFENVKIGDFFKTDKLYLEFDYSKILDRKLYIKELNLIDSKINITKLQHNESKFEKALKDLYINKAVIKNIDLEDTSLMLDDGIIELTNIHLIKNHKLNKFPNMSLSLYSPKLKIGKFNLQEINLKAKYNNDRKTAVIQKLKFDFGDGNINTELSINKLNKSIKVNKFELTDISHLEDLFSQLLQSTNLKNEWNFAIYNGRLSNCSYSNKVTKTTLLGINLSIDKILGDINQLHEINLDGTINKLIKDNVIFADIFLNYNQPTNLPWNSLQVKGNVLDGSFEGFFTYDRNNNSLTINSLIADQIVLPEINPDKHSDLLDISSFDSVYIKSLQLSHISHSSMDQNSYPIILKNGNIYARNMTIKEGYLDKIMDSSSSLEFNFDNLFINNTDISDLLIILRSSDEKISSKYARCKINNTDAKLNLYFNTVQKDLLIDYLGKDFPIGSINSLIPNHNIAGLGDIKIQSHLTLNSALPLQVALKSLNAELSINDLYVGNFDIETFVKTKSNDISTRLTNSNSSQKNFFAPDSTLKLNYDDNGKLTFSGNANTFDKKYIFNGKYNKSVPDFNDLNITVIKNESNKHQKNTEYILEKSSVKQNTIIPEINALTETQDLPGSTD